MRIIFLLAFLAGGHSVADAQAAALPGANLIADTRPEPAQEGHGLPPDAEKLGKKGLDDIYEFDFSGAENDFNQLLEMTGGHPIGYFGLTGSVWTNLVYGSPEGDAALEAAFWKSSDACIRKTNEWLKIHPQDADAYLALSGCYGTRSRLATFNKQWFTAVVDGRRALKAMRWARKADPSLYDPYLGIGTWEYYADVLPRFVKALSKMFLGGDRELGIKHLRLAAEKAKFVDVTAKLILIEIYLNDRFGARDPAEALKMTQSLMARYPASPLFLQIEQNCFFAAKDYLGLVRSSREYERRIKAGRPHFTRGQMPRVFVSLGTMHMAQGDLKGAREEFLKCLPYIGETGRPNQWALWGLIRLAQIEDAMGDREAAKAHYLQALPYKDYWGYRALAQDYIKHPFQLDPTKLRLAPL